MSGWRGPDPKPVKRVKPAKGLERRSELKSRPAVEGGHSTLKQTAAKAGGSSTLKASPKRSKPGGKDAGAGWRMAAFERVVGEHGRLIDEATGENLSAMDAQVHHVLEVSQLNAAGFGESEFVIWNPDNAMVLHRRTHERHHSWTARIPASAVREATWEFARMLDDTQGVDTFTTRLAGDYPEERRAA